MNRHLNDTLEKIHPRFKWAVSTMQIRPDDVILEIGCGVGFAVQEIVPLLTTGSITAVDKSPTMISRALERARSIHAGSKVKFLHQDFMALKSKNRYSKIFCFNINLFWTRQSIEKEAAVLRRLLSENGILFIFYGPMFEGGYKKIGDKVRDNLEQLEFKFHDIRYEKMLECCCFTLKP